MPGASGLGDDRFWDIEGWALGGNIGVLFIGLHRVHIGL